MRRLFCQIAAIWSLFLAPLASNGSFKGPVFQPTDMTCEGHRQGWLNGLQRPGLSGDVCRVQNFGNPLRINVFYEDFIVDSRRLIRNSENKLSKYSEQYLKAYLTKTLNLIDQMLEDYYREHRQLDADSKDAVEISEDELKMWSLLVKVTAYHESYFTHYQREGSAPDEAERLKVLMGDPEFERDASGKLHLKKVNGKPVYRSQGMFQRYDRARGKKPVSESLDLVMSIKGGIEKLYGHWGEAIGFRPTRRNMSKCRDQIHTSNGINYLNAALSAYAVYNGGNICRFLESQNKYAEYKEKNPGCDIDKSYPGANGEAKKQACINAYMQDASGKRRSFAPPWVADVRLEREFRRTPWTSIVSDEERSRYKVAGRHKFNFNLNCAREGKTHCLEGDELTVSSQGRIKENLEGRLFTVTNPKESPGTYCVYQPNEDSVYCTHQEAYVPCLRNIQNFPIRRINEPGSTKLKESYFRLDYLPGVDQLFQPIIVNDPNKLCAGLSDGVFLSGEMIKAVRDLRMYAGKTAGKSIGSIAAGEIAQVLDSEIVVETGFDRWYRIAKREANGSLTEGYIYGGDDADWRQYVAATNKRESYSAEIFIPRAGDVVITQSPLNVYSVDEKAFEDESKLTPIGSLPSNSTLSVDETFIVGPDQVLYLKVMALPANVRSENPLYIGIIPAGQIRTNNKNGVTGSVSRFVQVVGTHGKERGK